MYPLIRLIQILIPKNLPFQVYFLIMMRMTVNLGSEFNENYKRNKHT